MADAADGSPRAWSAPPAASRGCARRTSPGRYRCVYCLHRFELRSVCPDCGEHSTIVRMSEHRDTSAATSAAAACSVEAMTAASVAPSILAADFGRLRGRCEEVVAAGARVIHVDIMDGHFVPPLSMGPGAVERAARHSDVDPRRAPDDRGARAPGRGLREGGRRQHHDPRRGDAARRTTRCRRSASWLPRRASRSARARRRRCSREVERRHRAVHDRQPGLGRPGVHPDLAGEDASGCARCWATAPDLEVDGGIDRRHRRRRARRPARRCSSRARRCSAPPDPGAAFREIAAAAGCG